MNSEQKEDEKTAEGQNTQEIINEILVKRSKQQRKSWFGQDKDKDALAKSVTQDYSNTEAIEEEEPVVEKK